MTKQKAIELIKMQLHSKHGSPKLDFVSKLTEKEIKLLSFFIQNTQLDQRTFGIKIGFSVAGQQAEKQNITLKLPTPESIQIKPGEKK